MVDRNPLAVAAVAVVLVVGVAGVVYASGLAGPMFGGGSETATPTQTPSTPVTATDEVGERVTDGGPNAGEGGDSEMTTQTPSTPATSTPTQTQTSTTTSTPPAYDFQFEILSTESCGNTCRDVTVRLTNDGREPATGVSVESRILVQDDQIWRGTENLGTVEPGESVTQTKRVNLGMFDAAKVQQNGGYVTVETTVTWDDGSQTFSDRIQVT